MNTLTHASVYLRQYNTFCHRSRVCQSKLMSPNLENFINFQIFEIEA